MLFSKKKASIIHMHSYLNNSATQPKYLREITDLQLRASPYTAIEMSLRFSAKLKWKFVKQTK